MFLELRLERGRMRAAIVHRGAVGWQAEAAFESPEDLAALVTSLRAQEGFDPSISKVRATFLPPLAQRRVLRDLPPVRPRALRDLVALQQSRFFRRNGKPLVTNARWLPHEENAPRRAEAVAVEVPWLDAVGQGVRDAGLELDMVRIEDSPLTLMSPDEQSRREYRTRRWAHWLCLISLCCWTTALALHVGRLKTAERRLTRELRALEQPAAAMLAVRRQLGVAAAMITELERTTARRAALPIVLDRIVQALPDSAYLSSVTLDSAGKGMLTGAARQPAAFVARLGREAQLPSARLDGDPLPDGGSGGWERFTVRLGVEPRR